jgi:hypothetical protein
MMIQIQDLIRPSSGNLKSIYAMQRVLLMRCFLLGALILLPSCAAQKAATGNPTASPTAVTTSLPSGNETGHDALVRQVVADMSGLDAKAIPQRLCSMVESDPNYVYQVAYERARETALAHLLSAAASQSLDLPVLEEIFSQGIRQAIGVDDGARLVDRQADFILAQMKQPVCSVRYKYSYLAPLYVFSTTGEFWRLGDGDIRSMRWTQDRWVGIMEIEFAYPTPGFGGVQIRHVADGWQISPTQVHNGPSLIFNFLPNPQFLDGYRLFRVSVSSQYGPPPCDFGDKLQSFTSRDSCSECPVRANHAIYNGVLTYRWTGEDYEWVNDLSYQAVVVLTDGSVLKDTPPTQKELAGPQGRFFRPGSWRDYCVEVSK